MSDAKSEALPDVGQELRIEKGPETVRNERRWMVRTAEGETLVLAQLRPELADDESLRRRYVYEAERLAAISAPALARTLATGPAPDARDPNALAPWRLRSHPTGRRLDRVFDERAPLPIDEAVALLRSLCTAVHQLNSAGLVLRDLEPRSVVLLEDQSVRITDVGLARVDILSSRTASSLMLESSAYAAPEHLRATLIDARADLFSVAAIAWHGLTGVPPFDEDSPFLRDYSALPLLRDLRAEIPPGLGELLRSCLQEDPDLRPNSCAHVIDILQGVTPNALAVIELVCCQACGEELRLGLRLCLHCGKEAVQFSKAEGGQAYSVVLKQAKEDQAFHSKLRKFFEDVGEQPPEHLNFLVGDVRMYSKAEIKSRIKLPVALLSGLSKESANALVTRLQKEGLKVKANKGAPGPPSGKAVGRGLMIAGGGVGLILGGVGLLAGIAPVAIVGAIIGGSLALAGAIVRRVSKPPVPRSALGQLREAPLALPASDPYVARLGELLGKELAADLREQVSALALLVQRLCDHRNENRGAADSLAMLLEPLDALVTVICEEVEAIASIDQDLKGLDEGHLVRAIARSRAREEERGRRSDLLAGLDKLRQLEDRRATHMSDLLQAAALLDRTVSLGLSETDGKLLESNRITMALASLGDSPAEA